MHWKAEISEISEITMQRGGGVISLISPGW